MAKTIMLPAKPMLTIINRFILKQAPKQCPPGEHWHPGIVECHPKPPLPGSWHKDPKVRHTKDTAQGNNQPKPDKSIMGRDSIVKLLAFVGNLLNEDELDRMYMVLHDFNSLGEENTTIAPEDQAIIAKISNNAYEIFI